MTSESPPGTTGSLRQLPWLANSNRLLHMGDIMPLAQVTAYINQTKTAVFLVAQKSSGLSL